tara:strand:+ start:478 stop:1914 length:1437 start_codon:yes stop_codon:yes gene_type:complete
MDLMSDQPRKCPLCKNDRVEYEFRADEYRFYRCPECELLFDSSFPESEKDANCNTLSGIHPNSLLPPGSRAPSTVILARLRQHSVDPLRRIVVAGPHAADLEELANGKSIAVIQAGVAGDTQGQVDACVLIETLGYSTHPLEQLSLAHALMVSGGTLLLTLPTLDSPAARIKKGFWKEFTAGRVAYFNTHNLSALLVRCGFCDILTWKDDDGIVLVCRKVKEPVIPRLPRLSIVLPVFNEQATCKELIDTVLAKNIEGAEREIVIVESNSTDGSREIVRAYEGHPGVRIIYEERPRGKGYAVRNGLARATGDVLLIQDADLEYDIDDYDALLEPLFSQQQLFVLGSRHKGDWKMRKFEDRKWLSTVFNFGQVFFTWLINVACGTRLKDPFTMYKVFHRECLYGLELEANRFDLDWEIVIKFIRKGFVPLEIPVNYISRSFSEGKKVRPLRDPILWVRALLKFRYGPLYSSDINEGHPQ